MEKSFCRLVLFSFLTHLGGCFSSSRSGYRCGGHLQPPHCSPPPAACREGGGQGAPGVQTPQNWVQTPQNQVQPPLKWVHTGPSPPITPLPLTRVHKHRIELESCPPRPVRTFAALWILRGPRVLGSQHKRTINGFFSLRLHDAGGQEDALTLGSMGRGPHPWWGSCHTHCALCVFHRGGTNPLCSQICSWGKHQPPSKPHPRGFPQPRSGVHQKGYPKPP